MKTRPGWEAYYARTPHYFTPEVPSLGTFNKTHVAIGVNNLSDMVLGLNNVEAFDLEDFFSKMQGEVWSPKGEARTLIQNLGLCHTSMSTGDVVRTPEGEFYMVEMAGWKKLGFVARTNATQELPCFPQPPKVEG